MTISNSGNVDIKPQVVLFSTRGGLNFGQGIKIFDSTDKIPVVLVLGNKGKNMIKPEGLINMKGNFGETVKYEIIPKNILAQSERLVEATPSASTDCDDNRMEQVCLFPTSLILSGFFIGKYNLSTQINFGENSPTIFGSTIFYAFPFKIVGGILLTIVIVMFIISRHSPQDGNPVY